MQKDALASRSQSTVVLQDGFRPLNIAQSPHPNTYIRISAQNVDIEYGNNCLNSQASRPCSTEAERSIAKFLTHLPVFQGLILSSYFEMLTSNSPRPRPPSSTYFIIFVSFLAAADHKPNALFSCIWIWIWIWQWRKMGVLFQNYHHHRRC